MLNIKVKINWEKKDNSGISFIKFSQDAVAYTDIK